MGYFFLLSAFCRCFKRRCQFPDLPGSSSSCAVSSLTFWRAASSCGGQFIPPGRVVLAGRFIAPPPQSAWGSAFSTASCSGVNASTGHAFVGCAVCHTAAANPSRRAVFQSPFPCFTPSYHQNQMPSARSRNRRYQRASAPTGNFLRLEDVVAVVVRLLHKNRLFTQLINQRFHRFGGVNRNHAESDASSGITSTSAVLRYGFGVPSGKLLGGHQVVRVILQRRWHNQQIRANFEGCASSSFRLRMAVRAARRRLSPRQRANFEFFGAFVGHRFTGDQVVGIKEHLTRVTGIGKTVTDKGRPQYLPVALLPTVRPFA